MNRNKKKPVRKQRPKSLKEQLDEKRRSMTVTLSTVQQQYSACQQILSKKNSTIRKEDNYKFFCFEIRLTRELLNITNAIKGDELKSDSGKLKDYYSFDSSCASIISWVAEKNKTMILDHEPSEKVVHSEEKSKKSGFFLHKIPSVGEYCIISYFTSPNEFYLMMLDAENSVFSISQTISETVKKVTFLSKEAAFKRIKKFAVCYVEELELWCRVEVVNWKLEDPIDDCDVFTVDMGKCFTISYKLLQEFPKEMMSIRQLAIRAELPHFYPPHQQTITEDKDSLWWPDFLIAELTEIVEEYSQEEAFEIVYCRWNNATQSVAVDLFPVVNSHTYSFGQMLLNTGLVSQLLK